jgi:hypothetical protein
MSCLFLSDLYSDQINGGAENNDAVLIQYLRDKGVELECRSTNNITPDEISLHNCTILSNFILLSEQTKVHLINNCRYVIYEHDHKYVNSRDPSKFIDFKAPAEHIINGDLYANARQVVVLSTICKSVMEKNLGNKNVHSIGTSLWSAKKFKFIEQLSRSARKTKDLAILNSPNPTKGTAAAIEFCKINGITPDLIGSPDQYEFLQILSEYRTLLFIPQVLETFCRLVVEARMLNCNVQTKKNLIGFMSEPYSSQSGLELLGTLEKKVEEALGHFYGLVTQ